MQGRRPPYLDSQRAKRKSPADRADEFEAAQRRLKQEAADRRADAAEDAGADGPPDTETGTAAQSG